MLYLVLLHEEGVSDTFLTGTSGSAYTVHIIFCGEREAVVDNYFDIWNIQSPSSHIGCYLCLHILKQNRPFSVLLLWPISTEPYNYESHRKFHFHKNACNTNHRWRQKIVIWLGYIKGNIIIERRSFVRKRMFTGFYPPYVSHHQV